MAQPAPKRTIEFEGRRHEFPSDATDAEISGALAQPPAAQTAPAAAKVGRSPAAAAPTVTQNGFTYTLQPDGSYK